MNLILLGLLLSYNPFYIFFLMHEGALGGSRIRFGMISVFTFALIVRIFTSSGLGKDFRLKINLISFALLTLGVGFVLSIVGFLVRGNNLVYAGIDFFPVYEMFLGFGAVYVGRDKNHEVHITEKQISVFKYYYFSMIITGLFSYILLGYFLKADFGAIRAYVKGETVNRLMDFMGPSMVPFLFVRFFFNRQGMAERIGTALAAAMLLLSYYRSLYIAVFLAFLSMVFVELGRQKRGSMIPVLQRALLLAFIVAMIFFVVDFFNSGFGKTIVDRVSSIFEADSTVEDSKVTRIMQIALIPRMIDTFPIGHGLGAFIQNDPVGVMFNYFLQFGLLMGVPFLFVFIWLWLALFRKLIQRYNSEPDEIVRGVYGVLMSGVFTFFFVLNLFPYMTYFPFMLFFGMALAFVQHKVVVIRPKEA